MNRELAFDVLSRDRRRIAPPNPDVLPSRRLGREAIRSSLASRRGAILLTGDPGVGKTTLWRSLEADRKPGVRWVSIDASLRMGSSGFYALIAQALRVPPASIDRARLLDFLADRTMNGERLVLVVDEAQSLDIESLDEVRLLAGRIGEDDGFEGLIVVGQTTLARRTLGPMSAGLASRLSARVHLRPLDADEVGVFLHESHPGRTWPIELADQIHLLSGGLPMSIMMLADQVGPTSAPSIAPTNRIPAPFTTPAPEAPSAERAPTWDEPLIGPTKPPIRVEEGLIEVGWQPEDPAEGPESDESDELDFERSDESDEIEERIHDHYAALQAWSEWATNQGRHPSIASEGVAASKAEPEPVPDEATPLDETPNVWVDDEHGFAPYGRLFSRLSQENSPD